MPSIRPTAPTLIAPDGTPLRRGASTGKAPSHHSAADQFSQELSSWRPPLRSADSEWLPERDRVAARIHDVVRNNGWASGAVQRVVDQAIGADFRLRYRPDYTALGLDRTVAREFSRQVESRFRMWANDIRCYCDAGERNTLSGLLGLLFRHTVIDGEALAVPQWITRPGFRYRTAVQVVDPDRLSTPAGMIDNDVMRGGVEVNSYGAPVAYHIRAGHPGDMYSPSAAAMEWRRLPKRKPWGRQQVIHFFEQSRAGQTRGKSMLTPILERMKMESKYSGVALQAALVNAIFAAVIESDFDTEAVADIFDGGDASGSSVDNYLGSKSEYYQDRGVQLNGLRIPHLYPNEKLNLTQGGHPNTNFADFERTVLRYMASALGQSYEQFAQDWSSTNYSSARAALLEFWKWLVARRGHFAAGVATPVFALWFEEALDLGDIVLPADAPDFWDGFAAWTRCLWIGPGRGWVDPVKEAQAAETRKDAYLSTGEDEAADQGRDYEEILDQLAHERDLRLDRGLPDSTAAGVLAPVADAPTDPDAADRAERQQQGD